MKTNRTFFGSFRENCILERNSKRRNECWARRQDGRDLQAPPRTSFTQSSIKPMHESLEDYTMFIHGGKVNLQCGGPSQVHQCPAAQLIFDPGSHQWVQGCPTPLMHQHMLCGHLLQVQLCWLLTLLSWHRLGKPRGDYKTPFTWGISRHFANIESLISPSAPLKLAGIIGGAKERATVAALWL